MAGLIEHLESFAGRCGGAEPPTVRGGNRGYALAFYSDERTSTVISNGVRFQEVAAVLPEELACTLRTDQEAAAHHIVDVVAAKVIETGRGVEWDQVLVWDGPLLADTEIHGLLAGTHPYFDEGFNTFPVERPELRIVTLIPATERELALAADKGAEHVVELWAARATPLHDVTRACAVTAGP